MLRNNPHGRKCCGGPVQIRVPGFTIRGVGYPRDGGDSRADANRFPLTMTQARRLLAGAAQTVTDDPRRLAPGYSNGLALHPRRATSSPTWTTDPASTGANSSQTPGPS